MYPREMGHVEEAFDLPSGSGFELERIGKDVLEIGVVPFRDGGQDERRIGGEGGPDEAVLLDRRVTFQAKLRRDGRAGMGRDVDALARGRVTEAVIFADD